MRGRLLMKNRHVELFQWILVILPGTLLLLGMARPPSGMVGTPSRVTGSHPQVVIASPCEGYFLVSEYPGGVPLVEVGTAVRESTIVCYIQPMKRPAIPVRSQVNGTIVQIMFEDLAPVAMGDPLFRVELHK